MVCEIDTISILFKDYFAEWPTKEGKKDLWYIFVGKWFEGKDYVKRLVELRLRGLKHEGTRECYKIVFFY